MSMWKEWLIDASFESEVDGIFAFVPKDGDQVITGFTTISDFPPDGGTLVGLWHPEPALLLPFMERHKDELDAIQRRLEVSA